MQFKEGLDLNLFKCDGSEDFAIMEYTALQFTMFYRSQVQVVVLDVPHSDKVSSMISVDLIILFVKMFLYIMKFELT